jgi:hypothetical protein
MVRRSLMVVALLAVSSPLAAQEEYVWTSNRPDADAPFGVTGARTLDLGETEITYRFTQMNSQSIWFGTDSVSAAVTLGSFGFGVAPVTLSRQTHTVMGARGITENLTVMATAEFSVYRRDQFVPGTRYITGAGALGDVTATAIYEIYRQGPYRLNASVGGVIPIGKSRTYAAPTTPGVEVPMPYDMRPGGGTFAVLPGITGMVQNEAGSLGAQFKGRFNVGTGSSDFTFGDRYEANGWAAYRFNDIFSVSAGLRWQIWGDIEGADPLLAALPSDPASQTLLAGQRADMPVGVNFIVPGNSIFAGHRLFFEAVYALHHDYEGPQLGLDWGINLGWKMGL